MNHSLYLVLLLCLASGAVAGEPADSAFLLTIKYELESAYWKSDSTSLRNSAAVLKREREKAQDWHHGYYLGFIYCALAEMKLEAGKEAARIDLDSAVVNLRRSLEIEPNAESYILLARTHGNRMAVTSFFGRFKVAGAAGDALEQALERAPENPRAVLVDGISRIYRPGFAGGGYEKARARLERALELWKVWREPDSLVIDWGIPAEVYARWAELEIRNGNADNARLCIDYALSMQPDYFFVSGRLRDMLAELERQKRQ